MRSRIHLGRPATDCDLMGTGIVKDFFVNLPMQCEKVAWRHAIHIATMMPCGTPSKPRPTKPPTYIAISVDERPGYEKKKGRAIDKGDTRRQL